MIYTVELKWSKWVVVAKRRYDEKGTMIRFHTRYADAAKEATRLTNMDFNKKR